MSSFKNFIQNLQKYPPKIYSNIPHVTRQCSVALILRFNDKKFSEFHEQILKDNAFDIKNESNPEHSPNNRADTYFQNFLEQNEFSDKSLDILFLARAINVKDLHSGQIAFPGGKCEEKETDYETVLREVHEEIGIDLCSKKNIAYLGKIQQNFFAYYDKKLAIYVCLHIFLALEPLNFTLNSSEVRKVFWTPLETFTNPEISSISWNFNSKNQINTLVKNESSFRGKLASYLLQDFEKFQSVQINLNNGEKLYGFTLCMINYLLRQIKKYENNLDRKEKLEILPSQMKNFQIIYKDGRQHPIRKYIIERWYYYKRIKQFK